MPTIQTEMRVQIEGAATPALVQRSTLQVSSCEQISLSVDGVKAEAAAPARAATATNGATKKKTAKKQAPQKRLMQATYRPGFKNVKFVAIYDAGQASGLKVKVGSGKFLTLAQPLVFTERLGAMFGPKASIVLENESASPKTAVMLVGWDLPKQDRKVVLVKRAAPAAKERSHARDRRTNQ